MTNLMTGTFELRVTNIYQNNKHYVAFSGMPLRKGKKYTAKEIIIVNTKASLVPTEPAQGQVWRVEGGYEKVRVDHGHYYVDEIRINPDKTECVLPTTQEAIIKFLSDTSCFKGIGESKARALLDVFPNNLFNVLKNHEVDKLVSHAGLTQKSAEGLIEGFKKYSNLEYANWLSAKRVPMEVIHRVIKYHGRESIDQITHNPYRLLQFGLPFKTKRRENLMVKMGVDEIALEHFNIAPDDPRRLAGAVEDVMNSITQDGHSCAHEAEVAKRLKALLGNDRELIDSALMCCQKTACVKVTEGNIYHPLGVLVMENVIAKRLLNMHEKTCWSHKHDEVFSRITSNLSFPLTQRQLEAIYGALEQSVYAITGGAGTGKTTVLKTIMIGYKQLGMYVRGIALSGRAAMRMSEATGFDCCTIAKFLCEDKIKEGVIGTVIIDEASMIDLKGMFNIMMHIPASMRLLFVGDAAQLPPIGAGLVFRDIIESNVIGTTTLDEVKRTDAESAIPAYSNAVKEGIIPDELSNQNITFHECSSAVVYKTAIYLMEVHNKKETQVLTPTNALKNIINVQAQDILNPDGKKMLFHDNGQFQHVRIKENDPVIFTQNNYDAKIWNGTMGYLTKSSTETPEVIGIVEDDTGAVVPINLTLIDSLECAYAITLHKAQGSQFKRVIIAMANGRNVDRSWLYTAITRATEHVHIVGTKEILVKAIERVGAVQTRQTFLKSLLVHQSKGRSD